MNNAGDLWFHSKRGRNRTTNLTPVEEAEKLAFVSKFHEMESKGIIFNGSSLKSSDIFDTPTAHAQARDALPETLKSIENHGYLYHYAPREARESILEEGLQSSKARTKGALGAPVNSLYFFTDPDYAPSAHLMMTTGEDLASQKPAIVDMYRTKIEPGMLADSVVDARLPIVDGRGSSIILSAKSGSMPVELIAENVFFQEMHPDLNPFIRDFGGYIAPGDRDFLTDPQRSRVQPVIKTTTHGKAVDPTSVAPVQKAKPQAILPVTQQGKPVMNIPGHGQVIDPIQIATRRAQRQADLDEAFNPIQINQRVNAQRKAALPGKKLNRAQRRAGKNARALDRQQQIAEGSKLARAEAERLKAIQAAQQVVKPKTVSSSGVPKTKNSRVKTRHPGGFDPKKGIFTVTTDFDKYRTIPDPATMKPGSLEHYGREKVLLPRFEEQSRVNGTEIFEKIKSMGGFDGISESEMESVLKKTIRDEQDDLLRGHLKGLKKQYGPGYRAHLRDIATNQINSERDYQYYNKSLSVDTTTPRPMRPTNMSHGQAVDYISTRVRSDGGTLATSKSLYGFDQQVKKLIDDGIVSQGDVIDILKGKNQANEFGRILPRSSGAGIVSPPGQLTGMGNIVDLSKNAQQVISSLGLEDDMRLSYGEALLQSSRMEQQGGNLSTGKEKQLGGRLNLANKQAMMVDDEKIQRGARERVSLLEKEKRRAAVQAERLEAAISSRKTYELGETILTAPFVPAVEQAEEVVRKAPISRRTMEKMMSSHSTAAAVAAGGLGLIYASNKMRGEREVGR